MPFAHSATKWDVGFSNFQGTEIAYNPWSGPQFWFGLANEQSTTWIEESVEVYS